MKKCIILFILFSMYGFAQSRTAVMASVAQDENLLQMSFRSGKFAYIPSFGIHSVTKAGTDFSINLIPRFYTSSDVTSPFISVRIGYLRVAAANKNFLLLGLGFGGEHLINNSLAVGVELMLNYNKDLGEKGIDEFITTPKIFVAVYF